MWQTRLLHGSSQLMIWSHKETRSEKHDKETGGENKDSGQVVAVSKKRKIDKTGWFEEAKKLGCRDHHQKLDLAIIKLICCSGIPSYISDLDVWKGLFMYRSEGVV